MPSVPPPSPLLSSTLMMVDDDPLMTDLVQTYLEEAGYTRFIATQEPADAAALLRQHRPELLLLDLVMPGISGFEILEQVRADEALRHLPVIVLTAASDPASKLRALQLGATDFLAKPVDPSELVLRVRNTLVFRHYHERLIHYDQLTGLPNGTLFGKSLQALLAKAAARDERTALFSIGVPECRQLRESLDPAAAELLTTVVARRLERLAERFGARREGDGGVRAARLDEQHFTLVIDALPGPQALPAMAKAVLAALAEPVRMRGLDVAPTPWLGAAMAPDDGTSARALCQSADLALTEGRRSGQPLSFASPQLNAQSYQRTLLGAQLRGAAARGELRLHYQPKVDVGSRRIAGVEALVRWQHPERGLVPPAEFIPLSEEMGLVQEVGQWVIEHACRDVAAWAADGLGAVSVSVNVAKPQIIGGDLEGVLRRALADSGLPAAQLVVELTESMLMNEVPACLSTLHEIKATGISLSLDDFGTGYSSLSYLKQFPLDELKVDRSFVMDLPGTHADTALVRTVIDLGHSLGMRVVAEGVETQAQLDCLQRLDCDLVQGFLFSRPVTEPALRRLLAGDLPMAATPMTVVGQLTG
ncbi:GGDEF/EAL domain-containing response regulator [Pseudacidovorax intermedius]|uniref:Response regulator receiver modulated diguanylate cyclase/phosphodiesterase n=1 Tax=Pseudacidovorax intermedius TaxID=433924 RepID=A0A147GU84_9BURK|nr:EAL domain-containing protein [Pseudacidovorax intermedius]KTT21055.1 hypothetical protein NS331_12720 [Pseudacidovorax intermedius]